MRLSTKLLLISELVLVLLVAGMIIPIRMQMRQQVVRDMQHELKAIAATAALQIDGQTHQRIVADPDPRGDDFRELRSRISRIAAVNEFTPDNIYTFYFDPADGVLRFGVMLQQETFIGDPYKFEAHHAMAANTGLPYVSDLFTDVYGEWIAAVAPIRDEHQRVVGLLEVAKTADQLLARVDNAILITTLAAVGGLLLASIAGYIVLRLLVIRPVGAIHEGMLALARHDFAHRTAVQTGDEFEDLAAALNTISDQLNIARTIQAGFVPQDPPAADGYRFAYRSDPCDATGGDYIDAFTLPDGNTAILVADVTGHGIGPSLIMASCRSALRALAQTGLPPGTLLDRLEHQILDDLTNGRFITMIFGILEPDGRFTYTNAGHAPAFVVNDGKVVRLDSHRPPLGVLLEYENDHAPPLDDTQTTLQLKAGDRVVFTSDGVNESQDPSDEQFGLDRIEATARRKDLDAIAFVDQLDHQVKLHRAGAPPNDDITMLCVDRV
jgi:serine phosphatase RsbU (regulator of sigma subunit)